MRFQGLDLNLLVALDALNIERNITRAGERLHLSQSGMSSALARLREFFDDELFVLTGRELVPTSLAESLVEPVRRILIDMESSIINRPQFNPLEDARFYRISASQITTSILIPRVIKRLETEAPNIKLELSGTTDFAGRLERGEIDIALTPKQFAASGHPYEEIYYDGYKCICWEGNEHIGDTISLEQYQNMGHVAVDYGNSPLPIRILEPPMNIPTLVQTAQYHRNRADDMSLAWLRDLIKDTAQTI